MKTLLIAIAIMSSVTYSNAEPFAKGRILAAPKAGVPEHVFEKIVRDNGAKSAKRIGNSNIRIVELQMRGSERSVVARLSNNPHFEFAELDRAVEPAYIPTDPYYANAWHLHKINVDFAWDRSQGNGVTIAILDSGVDPAHPDLFTKLVPGWNFYDSNSNTSDVYGHGTKVAGAAAATTNNGVGVAGIAGQSKIMPIRVTNTSGSGFFSMIAQGIIYAADNGAKVANVSFLGLTSSAGVQNAAQYMKNKGGLVVVSGGNTGTLQAYAKTNTMISVSATDGNDYRASWSSYGDYITVAAPGVGIWTTINGGGYGGASGTSFSSPVTAGVIALMMAVNPSISNLDVENILFSTAVDLGAAGRDPYYGHGRINANEAVRVAQSFVTYKDTTPPTVSIKSPVSGQSLSGATLVDIAASDNVGVDRVDFRINNKTVAIDSGAPYQFAWDTTTVANGSHILNAVVFDSAGNSTTSANVTVNVSNGVTSPPKDTTAPVVRILTPTGGNVSGKVQINTEATDDSGSSQVRQALYIDGSQVTSVTGGQLAYSWNTNPKKIVKGQHIFEVIATDAAGNRSSHSVTVNLVK